MKLLLDNAGHADIRFIVLMFVVLIGVVATFLYYPPTLTTTAEIRTSGDITYTDSEGKPISGIITATIAGEPQKPHKNVNFISWTNVPNVRISYDAIEIKNLSVDLVISGDSQKGRVVLENFGINMPGSVSTPAPGIPLKYVEISASGVSFTDADILIQYTDAELKGLNEDALAIYHYDSAEQVWSMLPTAIDADNRILKTTVNSLSVFAVGPRTQQEVHDTGNIPAVPFDAISNVTVNGQIRDKNMNPLKVKIKTFRSKNSDLQRSQAGSTYHFNDIPAGGHILFDASDTKKLSANFKINKDSLDSRVILDDLGNSNPVRAVPPGIPIKYVDISAANMSFSEVEIRIYYFDAELGMADENALVIYHWNGVSWDPLPTTVDAANNILTATTTSLSPFAVSAAGGVQAVRVATNRYSVFAPFNTPTQTGYNADNSSFTFTAGALVIGANGYPSANTNINFYVYSGSGELKRSGTVATNSNGIAFYSYNTFTDFTSSTDTDYGVWTIKAELANNANINGSARMNIDATVRSCSKVLCHHSPDEVDADTKAPVSTSPRSPYSDNFGINTTKSMAYAAHVYKSATHGTSGSASCNNCHVGLDSAPSDTNINKPWGVHKNLTCTDCHQDPTSWPITIPDCYSSSCHPGSNNNLTNTSTLATIGNITSVSIYSTTNGSTVIPYSVHNGSQYSGTRGVPCWICHGPMHNITKPDPLPANTNNITEYTQCIACHNAYQRHNNSVSCTVCHSQDIHSIKVFAQNASYITGKSSSFRGNCTSCHQNPSFLSTLLSKPGAGSYSGKIPQVKTPLNHSDDPGAGRKWNSTPGYWTPGDQLSACRYCHGNTLHNSTGLGRPSLFKGGNTVNSTISTSTNWCASCHWDRYVSGGVTYSNTVNTYNFPGEQLLVPPEITGNPTYGADQSKPGYYNHSNTSKDDSACKGCHGGLTSSTTITGLMHNVGQGIEGGGPDCISCHDADRSPPGPGSLVNFTAMNDASAVHRDLNSGVVTGFSAENKKCWACHGYGSEPASGHSPNYKTPYVCEDCHVPGAGQNLNFTPRTIMNVTQHYWDGSNVTTASVTSCNSCHNRIEMMVGMNLDPDGPGSVYGGSNGGNSSSSHYGKKRSDMAGWDSTRYCNYCHNTSTKNITFFVSDFNNSIFNHSLMATTPLCSACHNTGRIHDSSLSMPVSDDSFCSTCHGPGGSATTNNKMEHKTLYCTECHANSSAGNLAGRDIHAIKYLTRSNTFTTSNSNAVDCVTCHQTSIVDSSLSGFNPFKIANPMRHSDNASNGSVWGSYWTTQKTSCIYCHNNTLHNATPLGRILQWSPGYGMYGSIAANLSCSDCHYKGSSNYGKMETAFLSSGLLPPPEITNGTSWKGISSNYTNHSSPFNDLSCHSCHGSLLSADANMSEFSHDVAMGINIGGATDNSSCISCHDINSSESSHRINNSAMDNSVHANLNRNATNSTDVSSQNKKCWGCHDSNGSQPVNDMGSRYKNPYKCYDCHNATGKPYASVSNAPNISEHYKGGADIKAAAGAADNSSSCVVCHNLAEMKVAYMENDIYSSNYSLASHYGRNRTSDPQVRQGTGTNCSYCHQNTSTVFKSAMSDPVYNSSISNHSGYISNPSCTSSQCHESGLMHSSTLTRPVLTLSDSSFCLNCHGKNYSTGEINFANSTKGIKEKHNNSINCAACHLSTGKDVHPVKYLQNDNTTWSTLNSSAVNCTTCHQYGLGGVFASATRVRSPVAHSDNPYNGSMWNSSYWLNTSQLSSCIYCHTNSSLHSTSGLGKVSEIQHNNSKNQSISGDSHWCANCHYNSSAYTDATYRYNGTAYSPVPPDIFELKGIKAGDGKTTWFNHTDFSNYSDAVCRECHGLFQEFTAEFVHNISTGTCTSCHFSYTYMSGSGAPTGFVNESMYRSSPHGSLVCEDCHTKGHNNIGARKACEDCHAYQQNPLTDRERHNITGKPSTYIYNGTSVVYITDCTTCHDARLYNNATAAYGYNMTRDCDYCHTYPDKTPS